MARSARGRQRTDSTHVLAAIRTLNRLELVGETLRAALNAIAAAAPEWLRAVAPPDWHARYDRRVEGARLPEAGPKREAYALQVGADGYALLDALEQSDAPAGVPALPAVAVLRRVWARHYERVAAGEGGSDGGGAAAVRRRALRTRGPGDRVESPYDPEARFRTRAGRSWTGYVVHLTETCDEGVPRLVVQADTTDAGVHEAMRVEAIHAALAAKGLAPSEHLADAAYMSAELLISARERHGIDLIGPQRRNLTWQSRSEGAFDASDFAVDWDRQVVRCPEGKESASWKTHSSPGRARGRPIVHARFRLADCRACPSRVRCTRSASRGRDPRRSFPSASTRRWQRRGRESARPSTKSSTLSGKASRARSPKACAPLGCAGRATVDWSRPGCSTSPPPPPSTSTASPPGSPSAPSRPPEPRASPRSPRSRRLRQQCPLVCPFGARGGGSAAPALDPRTASTSPDARSGSHPDSGSRRGPYRGRGPRHRSEVREGSLLCGPPGRRGPRGARGPGRARIGLFPARIRERSP